MDPLNQNQTPSSATAPVQQEVPKHSIGPVAGAVIVVLLLIAGGLYFWGAQLSQQQQSEQLPFIPSNDTTAPDGTVTSDTSAGLPPQSESDDIASIESDASAINLDQLNAQNNAELDSL